MQGEGFGDGVATDASCSPCFALLYAGRRERDREEGVGVEMTVAVSVVFVLTVSGSDESRLKRAGDGAVIYEGSLCHDYGGSACQCIHFVNKSAGGVRGPWRVGGVLFHCAVTSFSTKRR